MINAHPVIERYLGRFAMAFAEFEATDRDEIVQELRNHLAEARAAGQTLDAVLETLGPADDLARAYAVELALHPREQTEPAARTGLLATIRANSARRVRAAVDLPRALATSAASFVRALGQLVAAVVLWALGRVAALFRFVRASVITVGRGLWRTARWLVRGAGRGGRRVSAFGRRLGSGAVRRGRSTGRSLVTLVVAAPQGAWRLAGRLPRLALGGLRRARSAGSALGAILALCLAIVATVLAAGFLAVVGLSVAVSGLFLLGSGAAEISNAAWLQLPPSDLPPAAAMTLGPMLMAAGAGVLALLRIYVRFVGTTLPRAFPAARVSEMARTVGRWAGNRQAAPVPSHAPGAP